MLPIYRAVGRLRGNASVTGSARIEGTWGDSKLLLSPLSPGAADSHILKCLLAWARAEFQV